MTLFSANAYKYNYAFNDTPISQALVSVCKEHPDLNISFIYKELDNYRTSAVIHNDDTYNTLRELIGLNPISLIENNCNYYIEALQHGKFRYTGRVIGVDNEPVEAATVLLLAPKDSTVVTYGITDREGCFAIPCDRRDVMAKLICIGYKTTYKDNNGFYFGTIVMPKMPVRLKSVNVEVENTEFMSDKIIYRPTHKQKAASRDAVDLLRRMAIPMLVINPADDNVTDVFGRNVPIYINYQLAENDELKGLKTTDVKK